MTRSYVRDDGVSSIEPVERRKAWARPLIQRGPDAPAYGTAEWLALPDGPEKVAACVRAAECWATEGDELRARQRLEVEALTLGAKRAEDAAYVANARRHAEEWKGGRGNAYDPETRASVEREWAEWVKANEQADPA